MQILDTVNGWNDHEVMFSQIVCDLSRDADPLLSVCHICPSECLQFWFCPYKLCGMQHSHIHFSPSSLWNVNHAKPHRWSSLGASKRSCRSRWPQRTRAQQRRHWRECPWWTNPARQRWEPGRQHHRFDFFFFLHHFRLPCARRCRLKEDWHVYDYMSSMLC